MKISKRELDLGTKQEMEHTDDESVARELAKDHLKEFPSYYSNLQKMERKMTKEKEMETATPNSQPDKMPTLLNLNHDDVPELDDCAPGEHVSFQVSGIVKSNRMGDQHMPGNLEIELDDVKYLGGETPDTQSEDVEEPEVDDNPTEEAVDKMPVKELRKRLPVKKED